MAGLAASKDFGDTKQQAGLSSSLCRVASGHGGLKISLRLDLQVRKLID